MPDPASASASAPAADPASRRARPSRSRLPKETLPPPPGDAVGIDIAAMQHLLGFQLALAAGGTRQVFQRHVGRPFELREVEFTLLVLLHANHGAAPKQLAQALNLPAPKLSLLLDKLMARGLLERRRSPTDGRGLQLHLTPAGQALAQQVRQVSQHMEDELLSVLSPAERAMLAELLLKLARG